MDIGKETRITTKNAREMQARGVEKRKENAANDKLFKTLIAAALDEEVTTGNGSKVSKKMAVVLGLVKKAAKGDVGAAKWLADMLEETPEKKTALDVTSNGNAIEPITGIVIMRDREETTEEGKTSSKGKKAAK